MDVREKLVELLDNAIIDSDDNYGFPNTNQVADHLISNGVTVQEWVSVKDRLPEMPPDKIAEGYVQIQVLVWSDKGRQCAWFQVDTKTFYDQPGLFGTKVNGVTHWMPLPQPPKGE
jgi:hypothetical protein